MLMDFQNSKIFEYSSEIVTGTMLRSHCDAEDSGTRRLRTERNQIGDNVPWFTDNLFSAALLSNSAWPIPIPKRLAIQFIRVFCKGIGIHNSYFWGMGHANGPFLKGLPFKLSEQFLRNCNSQFLFLRNGPCTRSDTQTDWHDLTALC